MSENRAEHDGSEPKSCSWMLTYVLFEFTLTKCSKIIGQDVFFIN